MVYHLFGTFEALVKLKTIAQVGYILAIVITITRKHRVVSGKHMTNVTLRSKRTCGNVYFELIMQQKINAL